MPPPASFLAALHRLAAPAPQRVLRPVTNLRTLRWAHCPQVAPSAAAATQRVFQADTPAESPVAAAQEPPPPPSRALLLAKVRLRAAHMTCLGRARVCHEVVLGSFCHKALVANPVCALYTCNDVQRLSV